MNERIKKQIDRLTESIPKCKNEMDRLTLLDALRSAWILAEDVDHSEEVAREILSLATSFVKNGERTPEQLEAALGYLFDSYVTLAPNDFHSFLMALEWEREPNEKFYQPRMSKLRSIVDEMSAMMVHDKYDMMMLSMPPGTGKSTLGLFFLAWVIGREPEKCNLAIGYSTPMAKSFFSRVGSIDESLDYTYHKIFPKLTRIYTSAKELEFDYSNDPSDVKKPFVSLTCASVAGSLTGRTRCENLLYCDDLVEGAETAMSLTRLEKLWTLYTSNARSRKKEGCKELHIGTRWSLNDPIGRLMTIYGEDPRCKIISLPALDENDESNFNYDYNVGFSTEMFKDIRRVSNQLEWNALYMQRPMEAEGLLFPVDSIKRFAIDDIDLDKNPPDDIFAFCDVAFGGSDYLSMPILAQWGTDDPVVLDVCFLRGSYKVTEPMVLGKIRRWGVKRILFEANNGGDFYSKDIKDQLKAMGYQCNIMTQRAGSNMSKEARIIQHSPAILSFKYRRPDDYEDDNQYRQFMQNLVTFTADGGNEHDDAPDSLAGVATMLRSNLRARVKVFSRRLI